MTAPVPHGEGEGVVVWRYPNCGQWGGLVLPGDARRDPSHVNYAAEYRALPVAAYNALLARANTAKVAADLMRARAERAENALRDIAANSHPNGYEADAARAALSRIDDALGEGV